MTERKARKPSSKITVKDLPNLISPRVGEIVSFLFDTMNDPDAPTRERNSAAELLLTYGFGRPQTTAQNATPMNGDHHEGAVLILPSNGFEVSADTPPDDDIEDLPPPEENDNPFRRMSDDELLRQARHWGLAVTPQ